MSDLLRADNLARSYVTGDRELHVLTGVDLSVEKGEFLTVVGASGTGKSTLLHLLALLDAPTGGRILFNDEDLVSLDAKAKSAIRCRHFGFVFQFYYLLPEFDAFENLLLPTMIDLSRRQWKARQEEIREGATTLANRLGVGDRLTHKPHQLSGGEQQRVAIGRALINEPDVLFCDEPTGNLDEHTSAEILDLLFELNRELGVTIVMVTHNLDVARASARTLEMHEGKLRPWDDR